MNLISAEALLAPAHRLPAHLTPAYPTTYTLELTARCNHVCYGCGNVFPRALAPLSGAQWVELLQRLAPHIHALRLTGGECTLHPDFAYLLREVDQLGKPFVVFTNGCWTTPVETIAQFAACRHLKGLLISLPGHTPETYAAYAGLDDLDRNLANIRAAAEAGLRLETNTVLLQSNVAHLAEIIALGFAAGAATVAFSRYYGPPLPQLELDADTLRAALQQLAEWQRQDPRIVLNNCVPHCFLTSHLPVRGCTSGFDHCTIDPVGNARPCTHAPIILGNLRQQAITTIWQSPALQAWHNRISPDCLACAAFDDCRGGCRATAYHCRVDRDPLMRLTPAPITKPTKKLQLHQQARPLPQYQIVADPGGLRLVNQERSVVVAQTALPILNALDGTTTLGEIQARYGQTGVNFVGTLLLNGLIGLRP